MLMANDNELDGKIITLKSVYSKDRKLTVMPVYDPKIRWYLGVPRLSDEDKKGLNFWVDEGSKLVIKHNTTFDLNDSIDKENWEWVQHCNNIAKSFEDCQKSKEALFYVDNEEIEAQKSIDSDDLLIDALQRIKGDRNDMLEGRARLLGFNMEGDNPTTIRAFLNKMAKDPSNVRRVLQAYTGDSVAIQLLFHRSMDKGVIKSERGAFMYGNTILGVTEEAVIQFLQDSTNRELTVEIEKELNPKKEKPAPVSAVDTEDSKPTDTEKDVVTQEVTPEKPASAPKKAPAKKK